MVMAMGATKNLSDLTDEAECTICLHRAEGKAMVNEDMPSAVHWILETTRRLMNEIGEHMTYPSRMHWLHCCN